MVYKSKLDNRPWAWNISGGEVCSVNANQTLRITGSELSALSSFITSQCTSSHGFRRELPWQLAGLDEGGVLPVSDWWTPRWCWRWCWYNDKFRRKSRKAARKKIGLDLNEGEDFWLGRCFCDDDHDDDSWQVFCMQAPGGRQDTESIYQLSQLAAHAQFKP